MLAGYAGRGSTPSRLAGPIALRDEPACQGDDLPGVRDSVHRRSQLGQEERQACQAMATDARRLCLPGVRLTPGACDLRGARHEGRRANLDGEARDSGPGARPHRGGSGLGGSTRISPRGKPGSLEGSPSEPFAEEAKIRRVEHHAALSYSEIGEFMAELRRESGGVGARALEFCILTAARTGEVLGATWDELGDLVERTWAISAERMKADREHRVPLSDRVLEIVEELRAIRQGALLFPGAKAGRPLSHGAMLRVLEAMGRNDLSVHGFRSTFRDWAAECTNFPRDVCEAALAHAVENKAEAAYRRGDLFEKRRQLMAAWATYCAATTIDAGVVALSAGR